MTPSEADARQKWAGMDAPTAWLLIERHADGWDDIRQMLEAWARANRPAWHDAPTCEGLWLCDEGDSNPYCFTTHPVTWPLNSMLHGEGERWFGPIPEDGK